MSAERSDSSQPGAIFRDGGNQGAGQRVNTLLKVAVQGAGNVGVEHIKAFMNNPHTEIAAIGSRTKEGARRVADMLGLDCPVYDDYEALLRTPGLDIVSICTPPYRHAQECILAAEHGKHVLVEKPVALNTDELYAMSAAVERAGVKSSVGFVLRWNPLLITIKKVIEDGLIGRPILVHADYWHGPTNIPSERVTRNWGPVTGGIMVHGGCHAMDAARFVLNNDPVVQVVGRCPDDEKGLDRQRTSVAIVNFANGAVGKISASNRFHMPYVFNIEVFGEEGVIRNDRFYTSKLPGQRDFMKIPTVLPDSGAVDHHPFGGLVDDLVTCILSDVESHNSLKTAVNTHEACFAAEESALDQGRAVPIAV